MACSMYWIVMEYLRTQVVLCFWVVKLGTETHPKPLNARLLMKAPKGGWGIALMQQPDSENPGPVAPNY